MTTSNRADQSVDDVTDDDGEARVVPVNWSIVGKTAARLVRPGPVASRAELVDLVEGLREAAQLAVDHVSHISELQPARPRIRVVDRSGWARVNAEMVGSNIAVLDSAAGDFLSARSETSARLGAIEIGTGFAVLASRVLGQFDPFTVNDDLGDAGQLLLVAPNVLQIERDFDADPESIRLWVCLHEQTHAAQFGAAPWLRGHLVDSIAEVFSSVDDDAEGGFMNIVGSLVSAWRDDDSPEDSQDDDGAAPTTLVDAMLDGEERDQFARLTATMSVLEGHADVMMDAVGPTVVPQVARIRASLEARRTGKTRYERVLRRLMGLDAKAAQYRNGAAFVRGVQGIVGTSGFNAIWAQAENLPTPDELANPRAWVDRVHG